MSIFNKKIGVLFESLQPQRVIVLFTIFVNVLFVQAQSEQEIVICKDLQLIPLTDNVFMHRSFKMYSSGRYASNGMVYVVKDKAIMTDTPVTDSLTVLLINWFSDKDIQFEAVLPTHWHDDCLGGLLAAHEAGIQSFGLDLTIDLAIEHGYLPPQSGFRDSLTLEINDQHVECRYFGPGHTTDNIVIWLPSEKVLFGGCMVKALSARGLGNTADADVTAWPQTIQKVLDSIPEIQKVIPGHGNPGGKELLEHTYELLSTK